MRQEQAVWYGFLHAAVNGADDTERQIFFEFFSEKLWTNGKFCEKMKKSLL